RDRHTTGDAYRCAVCEHDVTTDRIDRDFKLQLEFAAITEFQFRDRDFAVGYGAAGGDIGAERQRAAVEDRICVGDRLLQLTIASIRVAPEHESAFTTAGKDLAVLGAFQLVFLYQIGL